MWSRQCIPLISNLHPPCQLQQVSVATEKIKTKGHSPYNNMNTGYGDKHCHDQDKYLISGFIDAVSQLSGIVNL